MKKRISALVLALVLLGALCAVPASALSESDVAVQTVRALGIMTGDENGNMALASNVTRAQFAKLLVAASKYKDTISPDGTGYSLYKDVKSSHWASEYIRIVTQAGWMTGYTDGTFRPEETITLEETCSAVLKLLGYTELAGSFPHAQLSKASSLGLRDGVSGTRGAAMTRGDCAQLFYNLLTAEDSSGKTYAAALGYTVANGEVDYTAVLLKNVSGPYVASSGAALPFTPATIYRDGKLSSSASLSANDVYYYSDGLRTVWIYTKRVSGKVDSVTTGSGGTPTAVTVAGKSYAVDASDAVYRLSALAGSAADSYVTLLLGMNDAVAGILTGDAVQGTYYGVAQSYVKSSSDDHAAVQTDLTVFCTDGVTRTFTVAREAEYAAGTLLAVTVSGGGVSVGTIPNSRASGRVNADATKLGDETFAENVCIIDAGSYGAAAVIDRTRLAGVTLDRDDVHLCTRNAAGEIDNLILNDATGDTWTYAYLTSVEDQSEGLSVKVSYSWMQNGTSGKLSNSASKYLVRRGGAALVYESSGTTIRTIRQLSSASLTSLYVTEAWADGKTYRVSDNVQVYLQRGTSYYLSEASAINAADYELTGWYDDFTGPAGGLIRIIIAVPKE